MEEQEAVETLTDQNIHGTEEDSVVLACFRRLVIWTIHLVFDLLFRILQGNKNTKHDVPD